MKMKSFRFQCNWSAPEYFAAKKQFTDLLKVVTNNIEQNTEKLYSNAHVIR